MSARAVVINLFARPAKVPSSDKDGSPDGSRWRVSVSVGDESSPATARDLDDPFDQAQREECRWYVESFITKAPFTVSRAHRVEEALHKYAFSLLGDLGLIKLVAKKFAGSQGGRRAVTVSISEHDTDFEHSVHQLYWELIEDPTLWGPDVDVTVKRRVHSGTSNATPLVHNVPLAGADTSTGAGAGSGMTPQRVNGLLVVARDLSRAPATYEDISPHLALGILTRFQDDLRQRKLATQLSLEVVRPGSLYALEKHLELATERHGKGHYHFVHFDLHGAVKKKPPPNWDSAGTTTDGNTPSGFLLFNDPDLDVLTRRGEGAVRVARALEKHGVPIAVLNACESASASSGDTANIAKTLVKNGVQDVLAMSFRVSRSAAELFLRAFYHALFLEGRTFSDAAREGRAVLRRQPTREARLGLLRRLMDSFVPVVYSTGRDSRFTTATRSGIFQVLNSSVFASLTAKSSAKLGQQLIGRDFDLLRLERLLLAGGTVYLSGRPGVGKTALLRYASDIWARTSFVDFVVFLDFAEVNTPADAITLLVSQLPVDENTRRNLSSTFQGMVKSSGFRAANFATTFWSVCPKRRPMVILDGTHKFFPESRANPALVRLTRGLLKLRGVKSPGGKAYIILAGRSDGTCLPCSAEVEAELIETRFRLRDLTLADSTELCQRLMREAGANVDDYQDDDRQALLQLVSLLSGNPATILHVAPQISKVGGSIRELRDVIHYGVPVGSTHGAGADKGVMQDIDDAFDDMSHEQREFVLLLSVFWVEAVGFMSMIEWMLSQKVCKEALSATSLAYLFSQGLIAADSILGGDGEDGADPVFTWIHPLLTLYGRQAAYRILPQDQFQLTQRRLPATDSLPTRQGQAILRRLGVSISQKKRPSTAAALVLSILGATFSPSALPEETRVLAQDFLQTFTQWVASIDQARMGSAIFDGINYEHLQTFWLSQAPNLATCLVLCTRKPTLAVARWPLDYFSWHAGNIRVVGMPQEIAGFAAQFEELITAFETLNHGLAVPPQYQQPVITIVTCLVVIYRNEVPSKQKREEYLGKALEMIKQTEEKYGGLAGWHAMYLKGLTLRYQAQYLLENGKGTEAVATFKEAMKIDDSIFTTKNGPYSRSPGLTQEQINLAVEHLVATGEDRKHALKKVQALSSNTMLESFYKSRKMMVKWFEAVATGKDKTMTPQRMAGLVGSIEDGMKKIPRGAERMGWDGLATDERWWPGSQPEHFDLMRFAHKLDDPAARLAALEAARASGNSAEASQHLMAMILDSMGKLEYDEIEEYIRALEEIGRGGSVPELQGVDWQKRREMASASKNIMTTLGGAQLSSSSSPSPFGTSPSSVPPRTKSVFDQIMADEQKLINLMKEVNAPPDGIRALEISHENRLRRGPKDFENMDAAEMAQFNKNMQNLGATLNAQIQSGGREFLEQLPGRHRQFQQLIAELDQAEMEAEKSNDYGLALERLKMLTDYLAEPGNDIFLKGFQDGFFNQKRLEYLFFQAAGPASEEFQELLCTGDVEGARRFVRRFESSLSPEVRQHGQKTVDEWIKMTDEIKAQFPGFFPSR